MIPYTQLSDNLRLRYCRHGLMVCLTTDHYIGKALDQYGEFSEGEVEIFRRLIKSDHTVLDIGANHGSHTVFLAKHAKKVYAFEPQPFMHRILCTNVTLNDLHNVYLYEAGVGSHDGMLRVPCFDYSKPGNFGAAPLRLSNDGTLVPIVTIDSLKLPLCDFIKIDAEGMEEEVLRGGEETINKFQPYLYLENDRPDKSKLLLSYLQEIGYYTYWHLPAYFNSNNFYNNQTNIYPRQISINVLAIPIQRTIPADIKLIRVQDIHDTWQKALARPGVTLE